MAARHGFCWNYRAFNWFRLDLCGCKTDVKSPSRWSQLHAQRQFARECAAWHDQMPICGAPLASEDIEVVNGAPMVKCHSCGTVYQHRGAKMVNRKRFLNILLVFIALILVLTSMTRASAQTYRFTLPVWKSRLYWRGRERHALLLHGIPQRF